MKKSYKCPTCDTKLIFDEGVEKSGDHPGKDPCMRCNECGEEYEIRIAVQYYIGKKCPICGKQLFFDEGVEKCRDHPGQGPCIVCNECGEEYEIEIVTPDQGPEGGTP